MNLLVKFTAFCITVQCNTKDIGALAEFSEIQCRYFRLNAAGEHLDTRQVIDGDLCLVSTFEAENLYFNSVPIGIDGRRNLLIIYQIVG